MYERLNEVDTISKSVVKWSKIMEDPDDGKQYFVKKIKLEGDNIKLLGLREMCFSLTIDNPHLVKIHEVIETKDKHIFIYDYHNEGNLRDEIRKRARENPKRYWKGEELLKIWKELINGLRMLEEYQCAHRDIRPENIIKCSEGNFKITKFHKIYDYWNREESDIKKPFHPALLNDYNGKSINNNIGNFFYSPEFLQYFAGKLENFNPIKSDVYSLGLVFLYMARLSQISDFKNLELLSGNIIKNIQELNYADSVKEILGSMLTYDYNKRPTFSYLYYRKSWIYQDIQIISIDDNLESYSTSLNETTIKIQPEHSIPQIAPPVDFKKYISISETAPEIVDKKKIDEDNEFFQKNISIHSEIKPVEKKKFPSKISECKLQSPKISKNSVNCLVPEKLSLFSSSFEIPVSSEIKEKKIIEEKKVSSINFPWPAQKKIENSVFLISENDKSSIPTNQKEDSKCFPNDGSNKSKVEKHEENIIEIRDEEAKYEVDGIDNVEISEEIIGNKTADPSWNCQVRKCKILKSNTIAAAKIYKITEKTSSVITYERDLMEGYSSKPSFLKFYGSFTHQDSFYMILEYVPRSLFDFINNKVEEPFNEDESIIFTSYLLKGLKFLEKTKVCHCDIKPENILLTENKKPKIIDFSSARPYDENYKGELDIRGTVKYLATEIIKKAKKKNRVPVVYDMKRADAFSLGVTLIETYLKKNTMGLGLEVLRSDLEKDVNSIPWEWAKNIVRKLVFDRISMEDAYDMISMLAPGSIKTIH